MGDKKKMKIEITIITTIIDDLYIKHKRNNKHNTTQYNTAHVI